MKGNTSHAPIRSHGAVAFKALVTGMVITVLSITAVLGQDSTLVFEAASIRASTRGRFGIDLHPSGRFTATNAPLTVLIARAYDIQDFRIIGATDWMSSDGFDIVAMADADIHRPITAKQIDVMIRNVLAERFQLKTHIESRKMPVYRLASSRDRKGLYPQMVPSSIDCDAARAEQDRWIASGHTGAPPVYFCGTRVSLDPGNGEATMSFGAVSLADFASRLTTTLGRVVIDETGISGRFDITLRISPESLRGYSPPPGRVSPSNFPSILGAVQEQLGLRMETDRRSVDVLVIDHAERPSDN